MHQDDLFAEQKPPVAQAPERDVWQRLTAVVKVLLVVAMIPALLMAFWPEWQNRERMEDRVGELRQRADELEQRHEQLTNELEWLQNDREYLEAVARARLHLAHEGETVVRFHAPQPQAPPQDP